MVPPRDVPLRRCVSLPSTKEAMLLKIAMHPFVGRMPMAVNVAVAMTMNTIVVSAGRAKKMSPNDPAAEAEWAL